MICPACNAANAQETEECFGCGRALFALTQGRVLAGRYEIRRPIGQGGMGKVYEAFDRLLEERVAIKVLRPQFAREPDMARRFLSEIRLARRITHPHVCRLHEYGESEGIRYLCMELMDGVNLKEVLRSRRLGTEDAYDIALAAAAGLEAVHAQGVIHRDFKTANIMVGARGQVKVMDFGIAKEVGSDTTGISLAGHVMGTPEYMSPEHAQGGPVDFRSDVYALGCVIFEVFAGRALFQGTTPIDTLRRHLYEPLVFTAESGPLVPDALMPVLARSLAKKPDERYASVTDLLEDMRAARATSALHAVLGDEDPFADLIPLPLPPPAIVSPPSAREPEALEPTRALPPQERPSRLRQAPAPAATPWRGIGATTALVALLAMAVFLSWRARAPASIPAEPMTRALASAPPPAESTLPPPPSSTSLETTSAPTPATRLTTAGPRAEPRPTAMAAALPSPPPAMPAPSLAPSPRSALLAEAPPPPITTPAFVVSEEFGVLNLLILPPSEVFIDGDLLGNVSSREIRLSAGGHAMRVENPGYHPYNRKVTIRAGAATDLVIDLSEKGVRKAP